MILVDTSAWVEYLRGTEDPVVARLDALIEEGAALAITEPVIMELLAGATTPAAEQRLGKLCDGLPLVPVDARLDFRSAARLYTASRRIGHPIRSLVDCLIAAVAIRREVPVLQRDRDYGYLAEVSHLRLL